METIMEMPIQDRKFYIMKHNNEQESLRREIEGDNSESRTIEGEAINTYAEITQNDPLMQRK